MIINPLLKYFLITSFVWGMYLIWLIPFQLYIVGMSWGQFMTWLVLGTFVEFIIAYPIAKAIVWGVPRIEGKVDEKVKI